MQKAIENALESHATLLTAVRREMCGDIAAAADKLVACLRAGHKLLLCGNGGSAADAQHL
ncbi:MAG: SIS domain-containing protein, partial [Herbaspirillum sp.]